MRKNFIVQFFKILFPVMLQSIASTAINLVDNVMVGQLGNTAISAVVTSNRYLMMFNFALWGIMGASNIYIAQYYGSGNKNAMQQSFRISVLTSLFVVVPVITITILFPGNIGYFFVKDKLVVSEMVKYLAVMSIGYIPFVISQNISSAMRAVGNIKIPVIATISGVITNTVLNYCLIFGNFGFPQMALSGAALATVISRFVEFIIVYSFYFKKMPFYSKIKDFTKIEFFRLKMIVKKSIPLTINELAYGAGLAMLLKIYATRGVTALTAYGIAANSSDLFYSSFQGLMTTITILVGHKLGENNLSEAKENAYTILKLSFGIGILFSIVLAIVAPVFPAIFNMSSAVTSDALSLATKMLYIVAFALSAQYTYVAGYMILRIGGDMRSTLLLDSGYMWCVNILILFILSTTTNLNVLVLMFIGHFTDVVKMLIAIYFVRKEKWLVNLSIN